MKNLTLTFLTLAFVILMSLFSLCIITEKTEKNITAALTTEKTEKKEKITEDIEDTEEEDPFKKARENMVEYDLKGRDITNEKVLKAMEKVPRHEFVPEGIKNQAYADNPLPIGYGQTISQPYVVALMTQSLNLRPKEKVLEIGTGSGYQAAILAELAKEVYTIEIIPELAQRANKTLFNLGYKNIKVKEADGYFGWEEFAPFDAIMITAAVDHIPPPLIQQLNEGGKLILPLGSTKYWQTLTLVVKKNNNSLETMYITTVRFVPMVGEAMKGGSK